MKSFYVIYDQNMNGFPRLVGKCLNAIHYVSLRAEICVAIQKEINGPNEERLGVYVQWISLKNKTSSAYFETNPLKNP